VDGGEVFEEDVVDVVDRVVSQRTDAGSPGLVAGYVLDVDVAAIAFDGYAVLSPMLACECTAMGRNARRRTSRPSS
jgi:hypothetical protein